MKKNDATTEAIQWGIPLEEIGQLGKRLRGFCGRFHPYLQTQTRDTSEYAFRYVSGLLRMETKRNIANIGRKTEVSGQNLQHFISNSPWSGADLIEGVLILDADNEVVGGVGISGDVGDNDEICAIVGIQAAGFSALIGATKG